MRAYELAHLIGKTVRVERAARGDEDGPTVGGKGRLVSVSDRPHGAGVSVEFDYGMGFEVNEAWRFTVLDPDWDFRRGLQKGRAWEAFDVKSVASGVPGLAKWLNQKEEEGWTLAHADGGVLYMRRR